MSTGSNSANKPSVYSEENEALYDPYPDFILNGSCPEPWPEWNDADVNAETWDEWKGPKLSMINGYKSAVSLRPAFEDPKPPALPPGLTDCIYAWKRPQELFQDEERATTLTVYDPSNLRFSLRMPSKIAPESEFFNFFIQQLNILQFYAIKHRFQVELEGPNFTPTTQGEIWQPWHQIYCLCKAGKGQVHKPLYSPFGKYIVRLFYFGAWRKFVVDDKIPCDIEGNPLLPVTQVPGELWPIILVKALLKIFCLTPTDYCSVADFILVPALTGWIYGSFLSQNKSPDQVWERFLCLLPRYEQPVNVKEAEDKSLSVRITDGKKNNAKKETEKEPDMANGTEKFCFLLAKLILKDSPVGCCWVGPSMVRDRPVFRANRREQIRSWKKIRWESWAKEKGLWMDDKLLPPYRRLQIINYTPGLCEFLYPDPKLEAVLYDVPIQDEKYVSQNIDEDPEMWCDYLKFRNYVYIVDVFFKPSCFVSNCKISCVRPKTPEITSAGRATSKISPPPQNIVFFPYVVKQSYNEPIYLLCEAVSGMFLIISLWVSPLKGKSHVGYLDLDQPKLLKIGHASLIVELHDWRSYEQGEIIGVVSTVGNSSVNLHMKTGRSVIKLWLSSDSPYVIDVYSNAKVFAHKGRRIRFLMSSEPQRVLNYITNVSNAFIAVTLKFGKPDLSASLREFYSAIRPGNDYALDYHRKMDTFIETFLSCILLLLKDLVSSPEEFSIMISAMRSLFINPNLRCEGPVKRLSTIFERDDRNPDFMSSYWSDLEASKAIIIQRYFRGYRIRLLWKCQTPARKEFKLYNERLKKICDIIFVPQKRELEVGKLLRKIVMTKPELLTTFKFNEDFANVLQVEEFTGRMLNVEPFAWVPIARFIIGCHSDGLVPCFFYLSCNLERVVVQGFNNDTGEEIFKVSNSISPHYYVSNLTGYTIFAFGWNEANFKTVNWRLEMVKMKHFSAIHLCNLLVGASCKPYAMPSLEVIEIRNFYVPNSKSKICRCLIKIQRRTLLTLRLSLSYSEVQFELIISLGKESSSEAVLEDRVVKKVISKSGAVIVPALVLECGEMRWSDDPADANWTIFSLEAYVLNNSWPLTKQDWGLVEPLRVNGESWKDVSSTSLLSKKGRPESRKRISRTSRKSTNEPKSVDNPFWLLQVLNDVSGPESSEHIVVEEDRSPAEAVKAMKASWREKDPWRRKRGREMRMKFIYTIHLEEKRNKLCGEDEEAFEGEVEAEDPQWVLDRLSSLSYLTSDPSPVRYICSPRILPATPLLKLLCKYRKEEKPPCSPQTVLKQTRSCDDETEISFTLIRNMIDEIEEDRKDYSKQCSHYRTVLMNHLMEEQRLSNRLMEEAYEERLRGIESLER